MSAAATEDTLKGVRSEPNHPLLLIPGICGSILHVRRKGSAVTGERVWVSLVNADSKYQRLWGEFNARSGFMDALDAATEVLVPEGDDGSGLYPISILDPDASLAVRGVHYMDAFIDYLEGLGYTAGKDLFGFGYDFRQSCRAHTQRLVARLEEASKHSEGRKVDVVTHSMGGLLMRTLLAQRPSDYQDLVNTWVAVGCPFGGAPGYTVDALITGVQYAGSLGQFFFVDKGTFRQACLQSPAVYELLPPLDFPFRTAPPQLRLWLANPLPPSLMSTTPPLQTLPPHAPLDAASCAPAGQAPMPACTPTSTPPGVPAAFHRVAVGEGEGRGVRRGEVGGKGMVGNCEKGGGHGDVRLGEVRGMVWPRELVFSHADLPGLLEKALCGNAVTLEGRTYPLPFNKALARYARDTQELWRGARLPEGCKFYNLYGGGLSTPYDVRYGSWWNPTKDLEQLQYGTATFSYVDGDMTVPSESALADGLSAVERVGIKAAHRDLISAHEAWNYIAKWIREEAHDSGNWVLVPRFAPS